MEEEPSTGAAPAASPPAPTTLRRNPPRSARPPPTPLPCAKPKPAISRLLDEAASATVPSPERLKVFLRIRPLPEPGRCKAKGPPKPKQAGLVCLVANGANSVALTVPHSKLVDPKRGRTEVFDGFSAVFSPDSSQHDVFTQVMNPIVGKFLGGKSGLLVAMGPTGSGKTHTVFGTPRNPGLLPLALRQIFTAAYDEGCNGVSQPTRSFCLSMFEILSEGKGERILDLLSDSSDLVLQQSTIKGLKEVLIENFMDAESLVSCGMLKRSTATTNANSKSSRSQCIITIRAVHKSAHVESEKSLSNAVLTIADLAGAERERRTGNRGTRLLESNFINNTSMVFGLCLRALLEHQKNKKKPLEKHFKNSMLTRYLRDYLEGRKKMTLILNVKPGDDDYLDTSFLLRQASPYMKINYTNLEDSSDLINLKRSNVSLICQDNKKKRKVHKAEVFAVSGKGDIDKDDVIKVSERDESQWKFLTSELQRVSRSEEIMKNFAKALWTVLKKSKQKLLESENVAESMTKLLRDKDIEIMELEKKLKVLSHCSCNKFPIVEDTSVEKKDAVPPGQDAQSFASLTNQTDLGSSGAALNDSWAPVEVVSEEHTCHGPESSSVHSDITDEEELSSRNSKPAKACSFDTFGPKRNVKKEKTEIHVQVVNKELDRSKICSDDDGLVRASSELDHPSDQNFTELHLPTCLQSERANLSPQFIGCSEKPPIEESEEDMEEFHNITKEGIQHTVDTIIPVKNVDTRELKHHSSPSYSQRANSDAVDVNPSQSSLQLQDVGAVQQNPQDLNPQSERCEATIEKTIVEYCCTQPLHLVNDHEGMNPCTLNEKSSPKVSMAPMKDSQAEGSADKMKDLSSSKTCNRRKLRPVSAMMLKEFTNPDRYVETKRGERVTSSSDAIGRSEELIQLLIAHPPRKRA